MNRFESSFKPLTWFLVLMLSAFLAACGGGGGGDTAAGTNGSAAPGANALPGVAGTPGAAATNPTVNSASPGNGATNISTSTNSWNGAANVASGTIVTATFSGAMNPATTIPVGTFTLKQTASGADVPGTVTMNAANTIATFTPTAAALLVSTQYTATVSIAAKSAGGTAMPNPVVWSFTTAAGLTTSQAAVNLGTAGNYVIFANTGITNATGCGVPCITGAMGVGPGVTSTAITGFGLILPAGGAFSSSAQVTGNIYAHDYAVPTPTDVTIASTDMGLAYTDAAGRPAGVGATNLNLGGGTLTTQTLAPGVYTWGTGVTLSPAQILTLSGGPNDVWIFQITGALTTDATSSVNLTGGALPKNVFWQVAGAVTIGAAPAHFEGIVLGKVDINFGNQATANSRLLAQTAVNLDKTTVTQPAP
jgi:hypothetical protein